ncbi:hypothetical protein UFOVP784_62 [uncultured Caudovirales phage]|uniref:Uncharacterized protein n=1 Tax=uncultured Caudovirales phage TaxID=2100421 RepID=A0A6J5MDB6_9CAUD|nr:hypothetical protein UFOVP436_62 [uncultured Caudovirales phage]CAB4162559.1 hypothetical protein UFOVP784_62 [uncultured Caudovirales phage]
MSILNRAGKLLNEASGFSGMGTAGKVGMGAMLVGLGAKGFYDQVAPATISAGMDVAFGDPQADRKILGTNLTPSLLYGASGLPGAGYARTMNAARFGVGGRSGPINNTVRPAIFGGVAGAAVGTAAVAAAARATKSPINPTQLMKGGAKKAAIGAAIGGGLGLAGTITSAVTTARTNEQIITQSPFYNQSALTAERLNASGNIVLGMHNQRRG